MKGFAFGDTKGVGAVQYSKGNAFLEQIGVTDRFLPGKEAECERRLQTHFTFMSGLIICAMVGAAVVGMRCKIGDVEMTGGGGVVFFQNFHVRHGNNGAANLLDWRVWEGAMGGTVWTDCVFGTPSICVLRLFCRLVLIT